ncbi:unnamed protein product, partial [Urochloa humidicola]
LSDLRLHAETIHGIYQIKKLVLNIFFSVDECNKSLAGFLQFDSECNVKGWFVTFVVYGH